MLQLLRISLVGGVENLGEVHEPDSEAEVGSSLDSRGRFFVLQTTNLERNLLCFQCCVPYFWL